MTSSQGPRVKITLRLTPALHRRLAAIATVSHRSLNAQILAVLERTADEKEPPR